MKVKVSIIVPVYQAEKYLERTIEALLNQTLREIEVILVDDGSKDRSPEICDFAVEKDNRFRCIHKKNAGVSAARNDGIKTATGQYLMFCDADDIPDFRWAEILYEKAKKENADVVLCGFTRQVRGKDIVEEFPYVENMTKHEEIVKKLIMPMCVWGYSPKTETYPEIYGSVCRGIYRKSIIGDKLFPVGIRLGEDMIFNAITWSSCNKISFVKDSLYYYFENEDSATHVGGKIMWDKYLHTWSVLHGELKKISVSDNDLKWHNYQLTRYAINTIFEGICAQKQKLRTKLQMVNSMFSNSDFKEAKKSVPAELSLKNRIILSCMTPGRAWMVMLYYQYIYNKMERNNE